jgi:hypothetical protein
VRIAAFENSANNRTRGLYPQGITMRMTTQSPTDRGLAATLGLCAALWCAAVGHAQAQIQAQIPAQAQKPPAAWELAGRQGLMRFVIVPLAQAGNRDAYAQQVALLCQPQMTCFINFFSNSTGAPLSVPLPDAIAKEPTALFRRSTKQGAELFRWSCRMGTAEGNCF